MEKTRFVGAQTKDESFETANGQLGDRDKDCEPRTLADLELALAGGGDGTPCW